MSGERFWNRVLKLPYSGDRVHWKNDGLWTLLAARVRATLAEAFAENDWKPRPWSELDCELIASATNRAFSLCFQAEATANSTLDQPLPPYRITFDYAGSAKASIPLNGQSRQANGGMAIGPFGAGRLSMRFSWPKNDVRFQIFTEVIKPELEAQLTIETAAEPIRVRPEIGTLPPEGEPARLWDMRARFTAFIRRFVLGLRHRGDDLHPFVAFLLEPKYAVNSSSNHVKSGFFGYGYVLDDGQVQFLQCRPGCGEWAVEALSKGRVPFPRGQCSSVYLTGRPTDPHDAAAATAESLGPLVDLERLLLGRSTLMEIPVYGTPWMYNFNAPDGPEFVLCVCLPNAENPNAQVHAETDPNKNPEAIDDTFSVRQRIFGAAQRPEGSVLALAEAQVLREVGQKLLSRYAQAYGETRTVQPVLNQTAQTHTPVDGTTVPKILVGSSAVVTKTYTLIQKVARSNASVLVLGESGVGKGLVARSIHDASPRRRGPFVEVNCAAIPAELIESELFGHAKGSFTGAFADKDGKFVLADGGTIFLDEIGDMSQPTQAKVLKVLEGGQVSPIGSTSVTVDVRVIAATNRNLRDEIRARRFRQDLFFRLNVFPIPVAPLRERTSDIPDLVEHFGTMFGSSNGFAKPRFEPDAIELLRVQPWTGNVRELKNIVERAVIMSDSATITAQQVQLAIDAEWQGLGMAATETARHAFQRPASATTSRADEGSLRLLGFLWSYPAQERQASWAVKESAVLKGDLARARDQPGLGVAIVTTELAMAAFGDAAAERVDRCIGWARETAEDTPPHWIQASVRDPITDAEAGKNRDLRHTLALGVILARAQKYPTYLEPYVQLALEQQRPQDGGWPEDSPTTSSPLFTAIYATELLHLADSIEFLPRKVRERLPEARSRAIGWLMQNRDTDGVWSGSVLDEFSWGRAHATAWVLHRLSQTAGLAIEGWLECLENAAVQMLHISRGDKIWRGISETPRLRVEARVAAAAARVRATARCSKQAIDEIDIFLGSWKERVERWVTQLPDDELDVATAAFVVSGALSAGRLPELGKIVLDRTLEGSAGFESV